MSKNKGFIMQSRGPEVDELMKDPHAFVLLTQIARRARRTSRFNRYNLKPGEALIGDHESIGITQANYRSAKRRLKAYGLATFKPTNKGTVATLTDSTIYDINVDEGNKQTNNPSTSNQQATNKPANKRPTTNNNVNNANNVREKELSRERGFNPGVMDPPKSVEKVKEIGSMNAIPPECCEIYFDMRSTDNFLRRDKSGEWKPIPNWHADLNHCYKKGYLKGDKNNGSPQRKKPTFL